MLLRPLAAVVLLLAITETSAANAASVVYPLACCTIGVTAPGTVGPGPGSDLGGGTDGDSIWHSFEALPAFDPALGIYLGYQIDITGTITADAYISADLPPEIGSTVGGTHSVVATGSITAYSFDGGVFGMLLASATAATECTGIDVCEASQTSSVDFTASSGLVAHDAPYTFGYGALAQGQGSRPAGATHRLFLGSGATLGGTATMTFFYTPTPEPGTALLLGAGMILLSRARSSGTPGSARPRRRRTDTRSPGSA